MDISIYFHISNFNPRPRVGGDNYRQLKTIYQQNFNPRPRVGGDFNPCFVRERQIISIHAPAWGATHTEAQMLTWYNISIHAPAWGATSRPKTSVLFGTFQSTPPRGGRQIQQWKWRKDENFNPRPRVGGDRNHSYGRWEISISIHAPAWGATMPDSPQLPM